MGDSADLGNFMGAVIDKGPYQSIKAYVDLALADRAACRVLTDGWAIRAG